MADRLVKVEAHLRGFTLRSLFVCDDANCDRIARWCEEKRDVELGEIGGKHSDVILTFDIDDFEVISEDAEFIAKFREVVGDCFGEDIVEHMHGRCEACGEFIEGDDDEEQCDTCKQDAAG